MGEARVTIGLVIRNGSNVAKTVTALLVRNGSNVQKTVTETFDRDTNNVSELFFNPSGSASLAVEADPTSVWGSSRGSGTVTTHSTEASATGGAAPYTYAWTLISYDNVIAPTADSPSSAITTFTQTGVGSAEVYTSTFRVTATDSAANTATTDIIANYADITP